eukprot:TRINITY_DN5139_c0_g2_i1.p1 TRINITY_DN5139_c0_g2~~TRINITY_DN5139_c0_g2_i1.p1  ORF type:complete len:440 (+),score=152.37 TRINITY_DN5139_c0_g2_i1:35-1321(+)
MEVLREQWWGGGLLSAAGDGDIEEIKRTLARVCDPLLHDKQNLSSGPSQELTAEQVRYQQSLDKLSLRLRKAAVNNKNEDGFTAVHMAVQGGHVDVLRYLVEVEAADINAQTAYGRTALHMAIADGSLELVSECLRIGADPSVRNANNFTARQTASAEEQGNATIIGDVEKALTEAARIHADTLRRLRKMLAVAEQDLAAQDVDRRQEQTKIENWEEKAAVWDERERRDGRLNPTDRAARSKIQGQLSVSYALRDSMEHELQRKTKVVRDVANEIEDVEAEHQELTRPMEERSSELRLRNAFLRESVELIDRWGASQDLQVAELLSKRESERGGAPEQTAQEEESRRVLNDELWRSFEAADLGAKGWLSKAEFEIAHRAWAGCDYDIHPGPEGALGHAHSLLEHTGALNDGKIRFDEFCIVMLKLVQY